jgi:hypothetical protein
MDIALNEQLLAAHAAGDKQQLSRLYAQAAEAANDIDARCFFLTHAYIFALDCGDAAARDLHAQLCAHGREA